MVDNHHATDTQENIADRSEQESGKDSQSKLSGKISYILLILLAISLLVAVSILFNLFKKDMQKPCTLEAKICPDGSSVGRTGPDCEFAPCPQPAAQTTPILQNNSLDLTTCLSGEVAKRFTGLGSDTVEIEGLQGNFCIVLYTQEIEGGYTTYRCSLPLPETTEKTSLENLLNNISSQLDSCQIKSSGNLLGPNL